MDFVSPLHIYKCFPLCIFLQFIWQSDRASSVSMPQHALLHFSPLCIMILTFLFSPYTFFFPCSLPFPGRFCLLEIYMLWHEKFFFQGSGSASIQYVWVAAHILSTRLLELWPLMLLPHPKTDQPTHMKRWLCPDVQHMLVQIRFSVCCNKWTASCQLRKDHGFPNYGKGNMV